MYEKDKTVKINIFQGMRFIVLFFRVREIIKCNKNKSNLFQITNRI